MKDKRKYIELKETNEYERILTEYNNHYGYDCTCLEHRCFDNITENNSHLNLVKESTLLKKR